MFGIRGTRAARRLRYAVAKLFYGSEPVDGRGAIGEAGGYRRLRQRSAAGRGGVEIALAREYRRFGGLCAVAQLHAGDSVALHLQCVLCDERPRDYQGRHDYGGRRPLYGVENGRRFDGGSELCRVRRAVSGDVRQGAAGGVDTQFPVFLEGREAKCEDIGSLSPVLRRAQGGTVDDGSCTDGWQRRRFLAYARQRQVLFDGLLLEAVAAGDVVADDCRADRP